MNIFPSIDTGVCATSVRRFNKEAAALKDTVVLCISKDLPFAQGRFCGAEGIDNVVTLSDFRSNDFAEKYGVLLIDGALKRLFARSVVVVNENGKVVYAMARKTTDALGSIMSKNGRTVHHALIDSDTTVDLIKLAGVWIL